jgi:putative salt-induced outer membrane protein
MRVFLLVLFLLFQPTLQAAEVTPSGVQGEEKKAESNKSWKGEAELGFISTTGNTETRTLNAKLAVEYNIAEWTHQFRTETLRSKDSGVETANRDMALYRLRYQLAHSNYLFGLLRYEKDVFAGYDQRTTEVAGYGHQIYNLEKFKWDVEAGLGARQTDNTDNTESNDGIVRLATGLLWHFTETSSFGQDVFVEKGSNNTSTEATTALKVKINSTLAMKLTYKIKDNSQVPVGLKHTDTETAVTLVYDFIK